MERDLGMTKDGDMVSREDADATKKLEFVVGYMKAHWPSKVRAEWQVGLAEYPEIVRRVVTEWSVPASKGREMVRLAGLSGSGKTTQLLPAIEAYYAAQGKTPVLVAARQFVKYHPHYAEILAEYGEERLRAMTDEFATIMMFLVLAKLTRLGCDILLDVTLLDPQIEGILIKMLRDGEYDFWMTMVAVAPEVTERFLGQRAWRHTRETELEFLRATRLALEYYTAAAPEMRIVLWNVWDGKPIYDGAVKGCLGTYDEAVQVVDVPEHDEEKLKQAKLKHFSNKSI